MMKTGQLLCIFIAAIVFMTLGACGNSGSDDSNASSDPPDTSGESTTSSIETSIYAVSVAETADSYDPEDIVEDTAFGPMVYINFSENTVQLESETAHTITVDGVTLLAENGTDVIVAKTDDCITIDASIDANIRYSLSGKLEGTLRISSRGDYQLYLDDTTISGTAGPALDLESTGKAFIVSATGTTNVLSDSSTRSLTMKAAVYGRGPMIFSGDGSITVIGNYKHGIFSKDYIRMRDGELDVVVTMKDAVRSVNGFIFDDGDLTINAAGTTTDDESMGIKVEGSEGGDGAGKGFVVINGGHIDITSVGKGITAGWDVDEDADTTGTSDDPAPYVEINNGVIAITTTGTPYAYQSGGETVSCRPEGIEGKSDITINSGYVTISTTEDSLNAGNSITLNGGYIYCMSQEDDAMDSNGSLSITGGIIVAIGSSYPEGSFDCDDHTFSITGGTFVGIVWDSDPTTSACSQNAVILGSGSKGDTIGIKADDNTVAFAFTIQRSCSSMILSSPDIDTGTRYTVYTGGAVSGSETFYGLYLGNLGYARGTAVRTFAASSCVTNLTQ
jgi:hypothetical protein